MGPATVSLALKDERPAAVNSRKEFQAAVSFGTFLCTKEKYTTTH
ncbi:hypothetical protein SELR_07590 [Selenomonas ruminantium subsp. lactilytica TAM6421]|uniref:Uncharacterized protein n=1 Tax=Selenomonas ruminantium subsp. lactilytica (strain NBRC 103574 / TAM6421) TaxID=927704 RepID=I0GNY0_SELRL|nr:hypothetical protein SELR_07590 [Selenomonas ruminantium subsp. lactilytica TAM6421]